MSVYAMTFIQQTAKQERERQTHRWTSWQPDTQGVTQIDSDRKREREREREREMTTISVNL